MKKLLLILCTLFLCAGAFSEIKYCTEEQNQKDLETLLRNTPDVISDFKILMAATCTTEEEVQKITKKKRLNLDDYFIKYMTINKEIETPYYWVANIFYSPTSEYYYWILYLHDTVEELYCIEY